MKTGKSVLAVLFCLFSAITACFAREGDPVVTYSPSLTVVEGDQPLYRTVVLQITAPANLVPGVPVSISPVASILQKPAGVSDATALSYVTFSPATLEFTQPNQALTTTITVDVPAGSAAGGYAYQVATPGWAAGTQDPWAFLNATIYPQVQGDTPTISIESPVDQSTFTYEPATGPLSVPFSFTASAPAASPITTLDCDLDGIGQSFTRTTNADGSITATGTLSITAPGIYTLRARATNNLGTSSDSTEFTVAVSAPPPVVSIAQPVGPSYTMVAGTTLSLPYSFSATSYYGGIQTLTATLNGTPVTFTPSGINTLNATGSGTFSITTPGTYTLVVAAIDQNGSATTTRTFTVTAQTPAPPTVTISQPVTGTVYTRSSCGSSTTSVPFSFTAKAANGYTISAVSATLNGKPVTFTTSGLNTATTTGTATLAITAAGTYTLVATATSNGLVASATTTFTVKDSAPPPPPCKVCWLPPISLGKVQCGGSVLPIKFELDCGRCGNSKDTTVVIAVYEIYCNGSTSTPQLYTYGRCSPNPPTYTINSCGMYHLNFPTARGSHHYRVEIYRTPAGSAPQLLGAKEFKTR